ncbi:site-specific integrase [Geomonas sp. Red32]|uniref:site-specific integrase n=1 Tax=Geomonas sp. Red32 TaxID=2912856 RepID=UPI00202CE64B|nr:site-specific integrase [Geomonas sp. Red32]MCM0083050.1 site-specific integrase [Geomonas sp. Red32]
MSVSFRSAKSQAQHIVKQLASHGIDRHSHKREGRIHGLGTERCTKDALAVFCGWLKGEARGDLNHVTRRDCVDYLEQRSEAVGQSALNADRQALNRLLSVTHPGDSKLPVVRSEIPKILAGRAYTEAQVAAIAERQNIRNALVSELAFRTGIRAHEALSIRPIAEQPRTHRQWRSDLSSGREDHVQYTVQGKGGLIRAIFIPVDLAERLEARRLTEPVLVVDRGIMYQSHYDISGGQKFSQSFSAASVRALGFSHGAHGCRHAFVQDSMEALKKGGYSDVDAREITANLVGHFRDLIGAYLR